MGKSQEKLSTILLNDLPETTRVTPITEDEMKNLGTSPTTNFSKLGTLKDFENEEHSAEAVENNIIFSYLHVYNVTHKPPKVKNFFQLFFLFCVATCCYSLSCDRFRGGGEPRKSLTTSDLLSQKDH